MVGHFPPPPPMPAKMRMCQRVPPAVFSAILGLFGLGIAWRFGAGAFGVPRGAVEMYLGAVSFIFLFALAAYLIKMSMRAGVLMEDLKVVPGRGGLTAMTMCTMLFASVLVPYAPGPATIILAIGVLGHMTIAFGTLVQLVSADPGRRQITPVLHIVFAGVIVSPAAAIPMKLDAWVPMLVWYAGAATMTLCIATLPALLKRSTPAPLRPLHAIHLAPPSLAASAAILVGMDQVGLFLLGWATLMFVLLIVRLGWLVEAGFSGFWAAFTFPLAAYAGAIFTVHISFDWKPAGIVGGLVLVAATLIILPIGLKVLQHWARGTLAARTNAAIA